MMKILLAILILCAGFLTAQEFKTNVEIGPATFAVVEIARTPEAKAKGLMGRNYLPDTTAMAFVSNPPRPQLFWMKNTLIPLDVIFLDAEGRILDIQTMTVETPKKPNESEEHYEQRLKRYLCDKFVFCALEIRAGLAKELGLKVGDVIPALAAMNLI